MGKIRCVRPVPPRTMRPCLDDGRRSKSNYSTSFALKTAFRRTTSGGGSKCSSAWRSLSNYEEMKMSQPEHFERLVLGSGEGGKFLAWHRAKSGRRTAVV